MKINFLSTSIFGFGFGIALILICTTLRPAVAAPLELNADKGEPTFRVIRAFDSNRSSISLERVTLDVFWCFGDEYSYQRSIKASELGSAYATAASYLLRDANRPQLVGEIRVRSIDLDKSPRPSNIRDGGVNNIIVQVDPGSSSAVEVVNLLVRENANELEFDRDPDRFLPNVVSVFVCGSPSNNANNTQPRDPYKLSAMPRVFFHVPTKNLQFQADLGKKYVRTNFQGVRVVESIEIVGSKSPIFSEVRYFHPSDAALAMSLAEGLSASSSNIFVAKQIPGFQDRVKAGSIEAWIGTIAR